MNRSFKDLFELVPHAALLFDENGLLMAANEPARDLFGLTEKNLPGMGLPALLNKKVGSLAKEIAAYLREHQIYAGEAMGIKRAGETFAVMVRAGYILVGESRCLGAVVMPVASSLDPHRKGADFRDLAYRTSQGQVATGVLHNIGNLLNSINISTQNLMGIAKDSKIPRLLKANQLFEANRHRLHEFITRDPAGRYLPEFYQKIGSFLEMDNQKFVEELTELQAQINLIKELILTQQDYARQDFTKRNLNLELLVEDALKIEGLSLNKHDIEVTKNLNGPALVAADKSRVIHILLNLIKNAKESLIASGKDERRLEISLSANDEAWVLRVSDNGMGMKPGQLEALFQFGFTTKLEGHGFGLYTCRQAMEEIGGGIEAQSPGPGRGAVFTLYFPRAPKTERS